MTIQMGLTFDHGLVEASGSSFECKQFRDYFIGLLRPYVLENRLGRVISEQEFDFDSNAERPDISFISTAKLPLIQPQRRVQLFTPDLAVEIVSEEDLWKTLWAKIKKYRRCGVSDVWMFDQDLREATQLSEHGDRKLGENDLFESKQIPGFSIRIGQLFDEAMA